MCEVLLRRIRGMPLQCSKIRMFEEFTRHLDFAITMNYVDLYDNLCVYLMYNDYSVCFRAPLFTQS